MRGVGGIIEKERESKKERESEVVIAGTVEESVVCLMETTTQ